MRIDRRSLWSFSVDIGHANRDSEIAPAQLLGVLDLIEIAGVVVVDRRPEHISEISQLRSRVRPLPDVLQLDTDRRIRVGIESLVDHRLPRDFAQVLRQHLGSVFNTIWATSIASCSSRSAPSMTETSIHGRRRGGSVRA